jgi:hypothetical protein
MCSYAGMPMVTFGIISEFDYVYRDKYSHFSQLNYEFLKKAHL